jgi:hypothetical protein
LVAFFYSSFKLRKNKLLSATANLFFILISGNLNNSYASKSNSGATSLRHLNNLEQIYSTAGLAASNRASSGNLTRSPDLNKSSKSLSKRSVSKDGKRSRTVSQSDRLSSNNNISSANQSPYTFRKVVQLFTSSQMMG